MEGEYGAIRAFLPPGRVLAATRTYCYVILARTAHSRVDVKFHIPEEYPEVTPGVDIHSKTVSAAVCGKLTKLAENELASRKGSPQLVATVKKLDAVVQGNHFLHCGEELKPIKRLASDSIKVKVLETKGKVLVKSAIGKYTVNFEARIPVDYPETACRLHVQTSSYPEAVTSMFVAQAVEVGRRCEMGYSPEVALAASNPIRPPESLMKEANGDIRISTEHLQDLKHDLAFLKQASELRDFENQRKKGNAKEFAHSSKERKEARRALKQMTKTEEAKEKEREEQREEEQRKEARRALKQMTKTEEAKEKEREEQREEEQRKEAEATLIPRNENATKSLAPMVTFFISHFIQRLPSERCQGCNKPVIPTIPSKFAKLVAESAEDKPPPLPVRVYCGHWFHYKCLDEFITTPPFRKPCPSCESLVFHPWWPSDVAVLEKRWAMEQAAKREIEEIADFLGD